MSQLDPTGIDNANEDAIGDTGVMTYEEVSGLSNGDLGIPEPYDTGPTGAAPGVAAQPAIAPAQQVPLPIP